jgi:hypothetical protein
MGCGILWGAATRDRTFQAETISMTIVAKILIKLALYFVEHPDVIKEIVDAIHAAKSPQAKAA